MTPDDRPSLDLDGSLDPFGTNAGTHSALPGGHESAEGGVEYSTGTTTVGIVAADGVVLATDRRASLGGQFVSNKSVVKVEQVHPTAAVTIAGTVGAAQAYLKQLRAEADLYENRRGSRMSMEALSTVGSAILRGLPVSPLLGGVDPTGADENGAGEPHLYQLDGAGGRIEESAYAATGSGMTVATGALEREYDPDADVEVAVPTAVDAVLAASERDTASGNGVVVARVTGDGVETELRDATGAHMGGAAGGVR
ncbi:proteasome subunit beta [Haloglomus litoreum]|uniref:proteasome subunit beta n=1 Tax=Haloglomus litoreum TaxID=3034026 RepID=UPI0023E88923|nr:proteasome subunit beta [Haloglomus sp. DT116]